MTSTTPAKRPAAAKKPADHQPKTVKPKVVLIEGGREITHRGITVTVRDEAMDDFELLDDLAEAGSNMVRMPSLLRRLIGNDGYQAVMDGLRDKDTGRVTLEAASTFVNDIFEAFNPNS